MDVDGSFWDAIEGIPASPNFDGMPGTFRLESRDNAVFIVPGGNVLRLIRHTGPKDFGPCF
jgi:hypothetical protein